MSKRPRVIVSVINDLYTDQRVHKVCAFLHEQGYRVLLVGRKRKNSLPLEERVYATHRMKLFFETGAKFYAEYNLRLFFFLLFRRAHILLANDLDTLMANYCAKAFKPLSELVYDSHEYFTEVPEIQERKFVKSTWESIERWIFPKLKKVYTVNESIATLYREKYSKDVKVVRNISPKWEQPEHLLSRTELNLPDGPLIIIQGAGINIDRGAEEAVAAMKQVEGATLILVGDGDVIPQLKTLVTEEGLSDKVLFYSKQPYDRLMQYTNHAAIGLTLDKDSNLNYRYSLPNKVFDYIHTQTAIVCTNLVEVTRVVETHNVGEVLPEFTVDSLADTLNQLLADSVRLKQYQDNCRIASEKEHWANETQVLATLFPKVE